MTSIEEDKAEVFAALIRHPPSILNSQDVYLRAKGMFYMYIVSYLSLLLAIYGSLVI